MVNHDKKSTAELRAELRAMRKEAVKPISKMRVGDISAEIERLKKVREETPAAAAVPSSKSKGVKSTVESIKEAKASEFPMKPVMMSEKAPKKAASSAPVAPAEKKKSSKLGKLMKMLEQMSDSEED